MCCVGSRFRRVPENSAESGEFGGKFRKVPVRAGVDSGGRFRRQVTEGCGACWCRFRRQDSEYSREFRCHNLDRSNHVIILSSG